MKVVETSAGGPSTETKATAGKADVRAAHQATMLSVGVRREFTAVFDAAGQRKGRNGGDRRPARAPCPARRRLGEIISAFASRLRALQLPADLLSRDELLALI